MTAYSSHLRVYEPLAAFPADERRRWEVYLAAGEAPDRLLGLRAQHRAAIVAAIGVPPDADVEHAFVHRTGGQSYLCPWRLRVRSWQAIADFRSGLPAEVADAFIPPAAAEIAERELTRVRQEDPDLKTYTRSATWHVPLRWFVPFEGEERRLTLDAGIPTLTYLTTMADARRRVARTLAVLRRALDSSTLVDGVEDLGRWLEDYHPRSLLELDYGGLARLFDPVELEADESAADVAHAVASLAADETDEAMEAYERVSLRWGAVRAVEVAN
ncbi:MAG TPA: hypothetical protein VNB94_01730 [Mycobacteriales bacterium]|nr:hypothetical protein [Mycobacteriales bacterium]